MVALLIGFQPRLGRHLEHKKHRIVDQLALVHIERKLSSIQPTSEPKPCTRRGGDRSPMLVRVCLVTAVMFLGGLPLTQCADSTETNDQQALPAQDDTEPATIVTEQCPGDVEVPADAQGHSVAGADVDGDGDLDTLHAYSTGTAGDPSGKSWVQVSFAGGGGTRYLVSAFSLTEYTMVNDGVDLDGDGTEEFFALVSLFVSGWAVALFDVVDCELVRVTLDNGEDIVFTSSYRVDDVEDIACVRDDPGDGLEKIDVISYWAHRLGDSNDFETAYNRYSLRNSELVHVHADVAVEGADGLRYPGLEPCPNAVFAP